MPASEAPSTAQATFNWEKNMVTLLLVVKMLLLGGMVYMGLAIVEKWALQLVATSIS